MIHFLSFDWHFNQKMDQNQVKKSSLSLWNRPLQYPPRLRNKIWWREKAHHHRKKSLKIKIFIQWPHKNIIKYINADIFGIIIWTKVFKLNFIKIHGPNWIQVPIQSQEVIQVISIGNSCNLIVVRADCRNSGRIVWMCKEY